MWGPSVEGYFAMHGVAARAEPCRSSTTRSRPQIALGEIPTDDDCANAAVFFASDLSSVITGQSLDVNGGEVFH